MGKLREPLSEVDNCGLPAALEAIGERWSFMILRAAFNGVRHFEEFLTDIGIARSLLANRLTRLTEAGILTGLGLTIGFVLAVVLGRVLSSALFGLISLEPTTFLIVAAGLAVVSIGAACLPARRALRLDPSTILRGQ